VSKLPCACPWCPHTRRFSFGNVMWGMTNGISAARGLFVHKVYVRAMQEAGVLALDALRPTDARSGEEFYA
jgi:hypothetical protein